MADPLNPKLDNDGMYELISRRYPSLTPEKIYQLGLLAGYDLTPPASKASSNSPTIGSLDETTIEVEGMRDESNPNKPSNPAPTKSSAEMPNESTKKPSVPLKIRDSFRDVTDEHFGETLTIIGAQRPRQRQAGEQGRAHVPRPGDGVDDRGPRSRPTAA